MKRNTKDYMIDEKMKSQLWEDPTLYNYWTLADKRIFYLTGDSLEAEQILYLQQNILCCNLEDAGKPIEERTPIKILIYTYGGDLHATYSLISTIESSLTPIITINMGLAMSAGMLILISGHHRYAVPRSQALIHKGSAGAEGTYDQMEEFQKNYKKTVDTMKAYILSRTNIDSKLFNRNKSKDWYISDSEQVNYGIVEGVIGEGISMEDILNV